MSYPETGSGQTGEETVKQGDHRNTRIKWIRMQDDSDYQPEKPSKNRKSRDIESESGEEESEPEEEDNVGGAGEEIEDDGETREVIEGGVGKRKGRTWRIKDNDYDGQPLTFQHCSCSWRGAN